MKQAIFAVFALHRHLVRHVGAFVCENEELFVEAVEEVKEYAEFIGRQRALNEQSSKETTAKIVSMMQKHHPDLFGEE